MFHRQLRFPANKKVELGDMLSFPPTHELHVDLRFLGFISDAFRCFVVVRILAVIIRCDHAQITFEYRGREYELRAVSGADVDRVVLALQPTPRIHVERLTTLRLDTNMRPSVIHVPDPFPGDDIVPERDDCRCRHTVLRDADLTVLIYVDREDHAFEHDDVRWRIDRWLGFLHPNRLHDDSLPLPSHSRRDRRDGRGPPGRELPFLRLVVLTP